MPSWRQPHWSLKERLACLASEKGTALLRLLPAEMAHNIGMTILEKGWVAPILGRSLSTRFSGLSTDVPGIGRLTHPIGLAAGFDKDCRAPQGFAQMGFSFIEVGTVTPQPQPGNPLPRMFRYPEQMALINRMGFNSKGASVVSQRLGRLNWDHDKTALGVNLGKNKDTPTHLAIADYAMAYETFRGKARYYVFNLSSPNTPGLRDLANTDFVRQLAGELGRDVCHIWLKLDPDMGKKNLQNLVEAIGDSGFQGVILSNTHRVEWPEKGGLSGHPLSLMAGTCLEWAYEAHKGDLPMIASGGILSGSDLFDRLARGALAAQIYTALVYRGPWVTVQLLVELVAEMKLRGFDQVSEVIGSYYQ